MSQESSDAPRTDLDPLVHISHVHQPTNHTSKDRTFPFEALPAELKTKILEFVLVQPYAVADPISVREYCRYRYAFSHAKLPWRGEPPPTPSSMSICDYQPLNPKEWFIKHAMAALNEHSLLLPGPEIDYYDSEIYSKSLTPGILRVNKNCYNIGIPIIYARNKFLFTNIEALDCFVRHAEFATSQIRHVVFVETVSRTSGAYRWLRPGPIQNIFRSNSYFDAIQLYNFWYNESKRRFDVWPEPGLQQPLLLQPDDDSALARDCARILTCPVIFPGRIESGIGNDYAPFSIPKEFRHAHQHKLPSRPFKNIRSLTFHVNCWKSLEWEDIVLPDQHPFIGYRGREHPISQISESTFIRIRQRAVTIAKMMLGVEKIKITGMDDLEGSALLETLASLMSPAAGSNEDEEEEVCGY